MVKAGTERIGRVVHLHVRGGGVENEDPDFAAFNP